MTIKVSMLFHVTTVPKQEIEGAVARPAGWSESFYFPGSDLAKAEQAVYGNPGPPAGFSAPIGHRRAALLPDNASIIGCRFTDLSTLAPRTVTIAKRIRGSNLFESDHPNLTLLTRVNTENANVARVEIRCLPDDMAVGGEWSPDVDYLAKLGLYGLALKGWQTKGRDFSQAVSEIISVSAVGVIRYKLMPAYTTADTVRVLRSIDGCGRRRGGTFRVASLDADAKTVTVEGWEWGPTIGGKSRREANVYSTMLEFIRPVRVITHKVGRPFFLFVGRRSALR